MSKLSTLADRLWSEPVRFRIKREVRPDRYALLAFVDETGRRLFTVNENDLFDGDGNFFEDDLP